MGLSSRIAGCLMLVASFAMGQVDRYMVFFSDKSGTPHFIGYPESFLSQRALSRRALFGSPVLDEDLPVTPDYVTQVRATGARAFFTTRWMNGVLVEATVPQRDAISLLPFVTEVELVAPGTRLLGASSPKGVSGTWSSQSTDLQLSMLALDSMHMDGYRGGGVWVSVLDAGFPGVNTVTPFQALRDESRIVMTGDFVTNSGNVYQFDEHGTNVLSVMAAESPTFMGGAPEASYLLFVTEDAGSEYRIEEYNWLFAAEKADSAGSDIIQTSVGYTTFDDPSMDYTTDQLDGQTAIISKAAEWAYTKGIFVVASAGNLGATPWQLIAPPADNISVLSVAAVTSTGVRAAFSSIGPGPGIKPDVAALGTGVRVISSSGSETTASGTSLAAPLVSSLVAGLVQRFSLTPPIDFTTFWRRTSIDSLVRLSASQWQHPDYELGYGIPNYLGVKNAMEIPVISAFPNPATDYLRVSLFPALTDAVLSVLDIQGKVRASFDVGKFSWSNGYMQLDISGLASGLYVLRAAASNGVRLTFRFVKL